MNIASESEITEFVAANPEIKMLEILMPDMNGIIRCKRIPASEFGTFFRSGVDATLYTTVGGTGSHRPAPRQTCARLQG